MTDMEENQVNTEQLNNPNNAVDDTQHLAIETTGSLNNNDELVKAGGISVFMAAMFVSGELAGTGVLALPQAVGQSGWIGIPLIVICGMVSGYNGMNLGKCWTMLLERYPEMRGGQERRPYPAIGQKAFGRWMRITILISTEVNLFGSSAVFMLLASENIQSILHEHAGVNISFCYWLLVVTAVLLPLSWLGTPKDFWPAAIGATVATSLAVVLVFADIMTDLPLKDTAVRDPPTFLSFSLVFGTMLFAFGGTSAFPTIQNDMKKPQGFPRAVLMAYIIVGCMYMPIATAGFIVYGTNVDGNILQSIPDDALKVTAEVLIICHVMFAFVIILNPFSQDMEELFNIPHSFHWKRCLLRSLIVLAGLFIAESIPSFKAILNLLGASATAVCSFIAPPMLYLRICSMEGNWPKIFIPLHVKIINCEIIGVGIIAMIAGTFAAFRVIVDSDTFVPPCYINLTAANAVNS